MQAQAQARAWLEAALRVVEVGDAARRQQREDGAHQPPVGRTAPEDIAARADGHAAARGVKSTLQCWQGRQRRRTICVHERDPVAAGGCGACTQSSALAPVAVRA